MFRINVYNAVGYAIIDSAIGNKICNAKPKNIYCQHFEDGLFTFLILKIQFCFTQWHKTQWKDRQMEWVPLGVLWHLLLSDKIAKKVVKIELSYSSIPIQRKCPPILSKT